jgi:flavin reductase (DIM6/NTAB) family NADH-FMN oxidoreductase RutF
MRDLQARESLTPQEANRLLLPVGINERYINAFNSLQFRLIAFRAMSKSIHSKSFSSASIRLLETRIMRALHSTFSSWKQQFAPAKDSGHAHRRIDSKTFRQVMREVASPVAVVASGEPGARSGLTATAICSVSDNPPTVLVCVNQNAIAHRSIIDRGCFSINFLSSDQEDIAILFSGVNKIYGEDRFAVGQWDRGAIGAPLLRDAICNLECQLVGHQAVATHTVFIGELISGHKFGSNGALLYQHGAYKRLAPVRPALELAECKS